MMKKPDGTLTTIDDLGLKPGESLKISHRYGKLCRFCKKIISVKVKDEDGGWCTFNVVKTNPLGNIISGFAKFSLTSVENLRWSYQGRKFELLKPDGKMTTAADLKMGDGDRIDIRHQR